MQEIASSCSLDPDMQTKRFREIADLASTGLLDASPTKEGVFLRLERTIAVESTVQRLIEAESECCPFLRFEKRVTEREIHLVVSGPDDARPLLDRLFELPKAV